MSYQYRRVNKKAGNDTVTKKSGLGYTRQPQCLSYKGLKKEEQRNKGYLGRFPHLQGFSGWATTLIPQAGYTTLFIRVDVHVHCCIAVMLGEIRLPILGSVHVTLLLGQGGDCRCIGQLWPPRASLY